MDLTAIILALLGGSGLWGIVNLIINHQLNKRKFDIEVNNEQNNVYLKGIDWLNQEVAKLRQDVKSLQADNVKFRQKYGMLSVLTVKYISYGKYQYPDDTNFDEFLAEFNEITKEEDNTSPIKVTGTLDVTDEGEISVDVTPDGDYNNDKTS